MVERTMGGMLRSLRRRVTALERRLARTPRAVATDLLAAPGDVKMTARATAPEGWLVCAGQSLLRADYPDLFAAIGTTYGSADSTRFNLPDARGRVAVGHDASQTEFDVLGEKGGSKTHSLTAAENGPHDHGVAINRNQLWGGVAGQSNFGVDSGAGSRTTQSGNGSPHNNLQPYIVLNYIIKT